MRKGWKVRIDEREYFENKRFEREERQAMLQLMKMKMDQDLSLAVARLEQDVRMRNETH